MIPRGTAATVAINMATTASSKVMGNRARSSSPTESRYQREVPRSPRSKSHTQVPYWMWMGRSSPNSWRRASSSSLPTRPPSPSSPVRIIMAASPGIIQNRAKTMMVASTIVGIKRKILRVAY